MKKFLTVFSLGILIVMLFGQNAGAQTTKTVGVSGNYLTLKSAFDAINAGSITGAITLKIISGTTDVF